MKKYEVYKNIRKKAVIWGLPISLFALMVLSILASLLAIIFSFSLWAIIIALLWNAALYMVLGRMARTSVNLNYKSVFPLTISNKKVNLLHYVNY